MAILASVISIILGIIMLIIKVSSTIIIRLTMYVVARILSIVTWPIDIYNDRKYKDAIRIAQKAQDALSTAMPEIDWWPVSSETDENKKKKKSHIEDVLFLIVVIALALYLCLW